MAEQQLATALATCRQAGRTAFIPYITAGDPTIAATKLFVRTLVDAGADIIELGLPFSDPIADGPTNQRAAERALAAGTTTEQVLTMVRELRSEGIDTPIVFFTYFNPILRQGLDLFAAHAREAGVTGILVVDLPPEEAANHCQAMAAYHIETVFLSSPTTAAERLPKIDAATTGFVYHVSRLGVTGRRSELPSTVVDNLTTLRKQLSSPVVVGFGISTPAHVATLAPHVDGVVVGSAIVRLIAAHEPATAAQKVHALVSSLVAATRHSTTLTDR